ncbi:glucuronate isomerase [Clostridium ljungdahlii]|uniref:Uronate isomerase n=1 Tax=Clostridium ljungdahlii TaxID=1538 RepID=A0A168LPF7_9CLOT|nr:glucuronate isomerase [Clostridium ljungdahlii]OAA83509.1 Uronate isomerase [Clostridium ljungdahlii]
MKKFMDENFLLTNPTAINLYNNYAKDMPIIDYHCHLSPKEIYEDKRFKNITEVWLYGDHYKWRAMRSNGIDEKYITGDSTDYEKFMVWAKTLQVSIGNPLYHWTHLELQRFFGIYDVLNEKTAPEIWKRANEILKDKDFSARGLIKRSNVKVVCTTDDPADSLEYHIKLKECSDFDVKVLPAFRPDKAVKIDEETFVPWIKKLEKVYGKSVNTLDALLEALKERVEFFESLGCKVSDHAIDSVVYKEASKDEVDRVLKKALKGENLTLDEVSEYKTCVLKFLGKLYSKHGWVMQLHIAALRNNNTKMFKKLGPDTGFDSTNDEGIAYPLARFLDSLEVEDSLPKTILYSLNPKDNYVLGSMLGNFQGTTVPGKIQFGAAWWFNDNKDGMIEQMKALANLGLLSRFVGMLTDSRSFLSYTRHEYFRRILCNMIGEWVENGEFPNDMNNLGQIVKDICYNNAEKYFEM